MASFARRTGESNASGRRLTGARAGVRRRVARARGRILRLLLACLCALPALLSSSSSGAPAQSGRVKKPEDSTKRPASRSTRPSNAPSTTAPNTSATPALPENDRKKKLARPSPTPIPTPAPTPRPEWMKPADLPPTPAPSPTPPASTATTPTARDSSPGASGAPPTRGQSSAPSGAPGQDVGDDEVVRITSNLVPIPATVVDTQGFPVLDLELQDFELQVDGVSRPLGDLHRADTPVVMAMLFDNSGSLSAAREFEKKAAVGFFRKVMRPSDRAAVFSVSTAATLAQPLTGDVRALTRTVENFGKPEGATALLDGIERAAEYLRPHPGRRVIVIVSDGVDTISDTSFEEALARAVAAHCQIYVVQTGHSDNVNLLDLAARRRMLDFTAQTGGAVYSPKSTHDLNAAFAQIAADLAQQYVLSYYPADERRDGRFHAVSLRVSTRPTLRVRTRRGYYAPKG